MITFPKRAVLAAAGLSALLSLSPAHAYVMSQSLISITNFEILGSDGQILDATGANTATPTGDFRGLTFTGTADQSVFLTGSGSDSDSASNPPTNPINFSTICVGSGCNPLSPDDSFPKLAAPATGDYAAADQFESGAPVTGLTGFSDPATVGNTAATALTTGSGSGSSDSNNNLNSSFVFVLGNNQATGITFSFDLDAYLQVAITGDEAFPGTATASYLVTFSLIDLQTQQVMLNWNVDAFGNGLNTLSLNAPTILGLDLQLIQDTGGPIAFSRTSLPLLANRPYQLSARINTDADVLRAAQVPEPATLGLLGISLLAFGATRLRRSKSNLS